MKKLSLVVVAIFFVIVILKGMFIAAGLIHSGSVQSVSIMPNGTIFLGYPKVIEVYHENALIKTFNPPTSRAYRFYLEKDNLIIGCATGGSKVYDANGNYISDYNLSYSTIKSISDKAREFEADDGAKYTVNRYFGLKPFEIKYGGQTILKEKALDYIFNGFPFWLLFGFAFINMAIFIFTIIEKVYGSSKPKY